jgi:hypothetical protein
MYIVAPYCLFYFIINKELNIYNYYVIYYQYGQTINLAN